MARRRTTINQAFAAAVAPNDEYAEDRVREAILTLGQDPDQALQCAYCRESAKTWDHVFATVKDSRFSGYGHRLGNLLPCCSLCNSAKGNKDWRRYLDELDLPTRAEQTVRIEAYLAKYGAPAVRPQQSSEYERLLEIKEQVLVLLAEADQLAKAIRSAAS